MAETALAIARQKAADRGIKVEFAAADAFQLERLGSRFETVLDCGLFHTFDGDERPGYVASLASVTERNGTLYVLCFSDDGPDTGPHPISQEELRAAFNPIHGWNVAAIEPDRIQTRYHDNGAPAWFATIKRQSQRGDEKSVLAGPAARIEHRSGESAFGCQTHDCWLRLANIPGRRAVVVRRIPGQSRHPFVTG